MHLVGHLTISLASSVLSVSAAAIPCTDGNSAFLQDESIDFNSLPLLSTVLKSSVYSPSTKVAPTVPSQNYLFTFDENIKIGISKVIDSFRASEALFVDVYSIVAEPIDPSAVDTLYKNILIRFFYQQNQTHFVIQSGDQWGEWNEPRVFGPPRPLNPTVQPLSFFDISRSLVETEAMRLLRTEYSGAFERLSIAMPASRLQRRPIQAFYYFVVSTQPPRSYYQIGVSNHEVRHWSQSEVCDSVNIFRE